MATYLILSVDILEADDRKAYDEYIEKVVPVVEMFGGKYILKSEKISTFLGGWKPDRIIIIEFENEKQITNYITSKEFQSIMGLREGAVDTKGIIVEKP